MANLKIARAIVYGLSLVLVFLFEVVSAQPVELCSTSFSGVTPSITSNWPTLTTFTATNNAVSGTQSYYYSLAIYQTHESSWLPSTAQYQTLFSSLIFYLQPGATFLVGSLNVPSTYYYQADFVGGCVIPNLTATSRYGVNSNNIQISASHAGSSSCMAASTKCSNGQVCSGGTCGSPTVANYGFIYSYTYTAGTGGTAWTTQTTIDDPFTLPFTWYYHGSTFTTMFQDCLDCYANPNGIRLISTAGPSLNVYISPYEIHLGALDCSYVTYSYGTSPQAMLMIEITCNTLVFQVVLHQSNGQIEMRYGQNLDGTGNPTLNDDYGLKVISAITTSSVTFVTNYAHQLTAATAPAFIFS